MDKDVAGRDAQGEDIPEPRPTVRGELSEKEMEDLAGRLATERVKNLKGIADPFEEWERARQDILAQMRANRKKGK